MTSYLQQMNPRDIEVKMFQGELEIRRTAAGKLEIWQQTNMSVAELITNWIRKEQMIPIQPVHTTVSDIPAATEGGRRFRIVSTVVAIKYEGQDEAAQVKEEAPEPLHPVVEDLIEQYIHQGFDVTVQPKVKVPPS